MSYRIYLIQNIMAEQQEKKRNFLRISIFFALLAFYPVFGTSNGQDVCALGKFYDSTKLSCSDCPLNCSDSICSWECLLACRRGKIKHIQTQECIEICTDLLVTIRTSTSVTVPVCRYPIYHVSTPSNMKPQQEIKLGTKDFPFETISSVFDQISASIDLQRAVQVEVEGDVMFGAVNDHTELNNKEIIIQGYKNYSVKLEFKIQEIDYYEPRLIILHNSSVEFKNLEISQVDLVTSVFSFQGNSSIKFTNCTINSSQNYTTSNEMRAHQQTGLISITKSQITCNSSSKSVLMSQAFQNIHLNNNTIKVYNGCKLLLLDGAGSITKSISEVRVSNNRIEGAVRESLIDFKLGSMKGEYTIIIENNQIINFYSSQPLIICQFCPKINLTNLSVTASNFPSLLQSTQSLVLTISNITIAETNLSSSLLALYESTQVKVVGVFAWKIFSKGCLFKVRGARSVLIEELRVSWSRIRLIDLMAFEKANVTMVDVRVHNMTMDRDSVMMTLQQLNQASLELHNSSFENISGGDQNSKFLKIHNGRLKIVNCKFLKNQIPVIKQQPVIGISNEAQIVIQDSSFKFNNLNNDSIITLERGGNLIVSNSKFENNTSRGRGSILLSGILSSINFSQSVFEGNTATEGGVFFLEESVKFISLSCAYIRNSAVRGGVMYSSYFLDGTMVFKESTFIENSADIQGHVFYILKSEETFATISGGLFMRNSGQVIMSKKQSQLTKQYPSYAIYLDDSKMIIDKNVTLMDQSDFLFAMTDYGQEINLSEIIISNYTIRSKYPLFKFIKQHVKVRDLQIKNMESRTFLIEGSMTQIIFNTCNVRDSRIKFIQLTIISQAHYYKCKFMNLTMEEPAFIKDELIKTKEQLSINDIQQKQFPAKNIPLGRAFIQLVKGPLLLMSDSQILNFNGQFIWGNDALSISILFSKISNITDTSQNKSILGEGRNHGSFIAAYDINFFLEKIEFTNSTSTGRPLISLRQTRNSVDRRFANITDSNFTNCTTSNYDRGPFEFLVFEQIIFNSQFVACKSKNGSGGALYLSCSHSNIVKSNDILDREVCIHYITQNTFKDNEAAVRGGAIFYETNAPINIKKNTYINNRAPFGSNYSSFPDKAAFVRINEEVKEVIPLDDEFTSILSWSSQKPLTFTVALLENNGQVYIQNDSLIQCRIEQPTKLYYFGKSVAQMSAEGIYQFQITKIIGSRNSTAKLRILCENSVRENLSKIKHSFQFQLSLNLHFPECSKGEIRLKEECIPCKKDYYSFNHQDANCNKCFPHAKCLGRNVTLVEKGYWRESNQSTEVYYCPQKSACLQYILSLSYRGGVNSQCSEGYTGVMCNQCLREVDKVYVKTAGGECKQCSSFAIQITLVILKISIFVIHVIYILKQVPLAFIYSFQLCFDESKEEQATDCAYKDPDKLLARFNDIHGAQYQIVLSV